MEVPRLMSNKSFVSSVFCRRVITVSPGCSRVAWYAAGMTSVEHANTINDELA